MMNKTVVFDKQVLNPVRGVSEPSGLTDCTACCAMSCK